MKIKYLCKRNPVAHTQVMVQFREYWVKFYACVNYEGEKDDDKSLCWPKFYDSSSPGGVTREQTYWHFKMVGPVGIFQSSGLLF